MRSLTRLGILLIVENNSGFTLADQKIYLDDGGRGSQYVLPVKTSIFVFSLGLVRLPRSGPTTQRSSFSIICVRAAINWHLALAVHATLTPLVDINVMTFASSNPSGTPGLPG